MAYMALIMIPWQYQDACSFLKVTVAVRAPGLVTYLTQLAASTV